MAALCLGACAGGRTCPEVSGAAALAPTEQLLVMRGGPGERMPIVENDTPAGDAFLHTPSRPVRVGDPAVGHLLKRMHATVLEEGGVGIAAPQVGINRRAIWVKRVDLEPEQPFRSYLNIEVVETSGAPVEEWEGCLSIPAGFGRVVRSSAVTVAYDREDGQRVEETVEGYAARIFMHEIDHLDGLLFVDRRPGDAPPLMPEDEYRAMRRREKAEKDAAAAPAGPEPPAGPEATEGGADGE